MSVARVMGDLAHRLSQNEARYGVVNDTLVDGTGPETRWLLPYTRDSAQWIERKLREDYEEFEEGAPVTWLHILREELAEAAMEDDPAKLRDELLDVGAVIAGWVLRLNRRAATESVAQPSNFH